MKLFGRWNGTGAKPDKFAEAAAALEARAEGLRAGNLANGMTGITTDTTFSTAELISSLGTFVRALGIASTAADRATNLIKWLTIVGVFIALTNVGLVVAQIFEANNIADEQNAITLNGQVFHDPTNIQIIEAIENKRPILVQNHGRITPTELDSYLADLDTVETAFKKKQITEQELCYSYSYFVLKTFQNSEIKQYLHDNPDFFAGVVDLNETIENSRLDDCH